MPDKGDECHQETDNSQIGLTVFQAVGGPGLFPFVDLDHPADYIENKSQRHEEP